MGIKKLWSVRELVTESGRTEREIRKKIRDGIIPVIRIGSNGYNVAIKDADARKFLEGLQMSRPAAK